MSCIFDKNELFNYLLNIFNKLNDLNHQNAKEILCFLILFFLNPKKKEPCPSCDPVKFFPKKTEG